MSQLNQNNHESEKLIQGLFRLNATFPDFPLVPLNNNKQPLGDGWQNRPFTPSELIQAISSGDSDRPSLGT